MNPSTHLARDLLDELVHQGVREVVLSPGSRSAPLAFAAARLARAGRVRLHVRLDERCAGFLAVGLARTSGEPVAVVCTSGTAVANLHPAVLEAAVVGIPDPTRGEEVKAFIVTRDGSTLSEKEAIDYCRERIANYKCPRQIEFVSSLPKGPTGKVLKRELRNLTPAG